MALCNDYQPLAIILSAKRLNCRPHDQKPVWFCHKSCKVCLRKRFALAGTGKERELKRRTNNHRSKHKDNRLHEGYKFKKDRSLRDKKTTKYGVSTILEDETKNKVEEEE